MKSPEGYVILTSETIKLMQTNKTTLPSCVMYYGASYKHFRKSNMTGKVPGPTSVHTYAVSKEAWIHLFEEPAKKPKPLIGLDPLAHPPNCLIKLTSSERDALKGVHYPGGTMYWSSNAKWRPALSGFFNTENIYAVHQEFYNKHCKPNPAYPPIPEGYVPLNLGKNDTVPEGAMMHFGRLESWVGSKAIGGTPDPYCTYIAPIVVKEPPKKKTPTPPAGYRLLTQEDKNGPVPEGMKYWYIRNEEWLRHALGPGYKMVSSTHYAAPIERPAEKPAEKPEYPPIPEGYELATEKVGIPPEGAKYACGNRWVESKNRMFGDNYATNNTYIIPIIEKATPKKVTRLYIDPPPGCRIVRESEKGKPRQSGSFCRTPNDPAWTPCKAYHSACYLKCMIYAVPITNNLTTSSGEVPEDSNKTPENPATTGGKRMFNTSLSNELAKAKDRNLNAGQTALRLKVGRTVVENATGLLIDAAPLAAKGLLRKNERVTKFIVANLLATAAGLSDNFALKQFADAGIVHTINGVAELLDTDHLIDTITAGLSKADVGSFLGKEDATDA